MKKVFLLTGLATAGIFAMAAEVPEPQVFPDTYLYAISPNGQYGVSHLTSGLKIYNFVTGQVDEFFNETVYYSAGIGKCVSNNGIILGSSDDVNAEYFKDGEWYTLDVPEEASSTCLSNAITPDGSRICGSIGVSGISLEGDALMQIPVIWNATADGYGQAVKLPYPELDFTGRVPQYVTAVDISDDGKKVIGQVVSATGMLCYPILYTEGADGKWSYELVHPELYTIPGLEFPKYPGEGPQQPQAQEYMTVEEEAAYDQALQEYYDSGYTLPYPVATDFLSPEAKEEYDADMEKYQEEYDEWNTAFYAWFYAFDKVLAIAPNDEFNSVRISPDGKTYGYTVSVSDPFDPWAASTYNVWIFDADSDVITKYNHTGDLNLSYLGNGFALASSSIQAVSNSYVLKDGMCDSMIWWMNSQCPAYAGWINENMRFSYEDMVINEETGEYEIVTIEDALMTGHATGTPDLSHLALSVQNVWDYSTEFDAYLFDVKAGTAGVQSVRPAVDGEQVIYDLHGRRLNSASAPGIYIINGKKQVVR